MVLLFLALLVLVAFIVGAVEGGVGVISTDANSFETEMNQSSSKSKTINMYSTGSKSVDNLEVTCSGNACNYISFNQSYIRTKL